MPIDLLFAVRGLLAFVSFTEITTAARCLLPSPILPKGDQFVRDKLFSRVDFQTISAERIVSHLYGIIALVSAVTLIHLAVFTHYKPISSLALIVTILKTLLLISYALFFEYIQIDHNLISPLVSGLLSLAAISLVPFVTNRSKVGGITDENQELVRQMRMLKRKTKRA